MLDFSRLRTLPDLLACHADTQPDSIALQFEGRSTSYKALHLDSDALARTLCQLDPTPGSRVAYLGKNSDRYFELLFATAKAGKVLVPLNWRLASDEWAWILEDASATHLFTDSAFAAAGTGLAGRLALTAITTLDGSWNYMIKNSATDCVLAPCASSDVVLQVYTSGTTGTPKGVLLSHGNLLALREPGLRAELEWFPRKGDTSLVAMPVAHIAGTAYGLFGLHSGGRLVICQEFNAAPIWELLRQAGITHMLLAPTALRMLLECAEAQHASAPDLNYITYGGSPIDPAVLQHAIARLDCGFVQMYGMTEAAGGVVALNPQDHEKPELLSTAGRPMPGVEIAVVDSEGQCLPCGATGEIVVRSGSVMTGYWQLPQATADALDAQGWLRTGDIGRIDSAGYLSVIDRARDTIISGGENVYPLEVENRLREHPSVVDVAVIGVPSTQWGEEVKAIIVPAQPGSFDVTAVLAYAREHLAAFKVPKSVELVAELPRNAGGKVLRRVLREPYWKGRDKRVG